MADDIRARVDDRQDLASLFSRIRRHIPLIVACIVAGVITAAVITMLLPKRYTANAQLNYAPQEAVIKGTTSQTLSDQAREAEIEAQLQIIQSLPVAAEVVKRQRLDRDPELAKLAQRYVGRQQNAEQAMAAAVLNDVRARRVGQTTLFNVGFTSKDPLQAMTVANAFAEVYLDRQLATKLQRSKETSRRLDTRLEQLRRQVEQADAAVARFRVRNSLINQPDSTAPEAEIATIRSEIAQARADAASASVRSAAAARETVVGGGTNGPINTTTVSQLRQQKAEVARRVASLSARYGERHPLIIDAQKEQAAIDAQIADEMRRLAATAGAESAVAGSREASLQASLASAQRRLAGNVAAGVQLADLQRQAQNARELYQNLLTTSGEQSAQRDLVTADSRLASPATLPLRPSSPNMVINLFLGLVAGLALGLAIAFLRERWSQGLDTVDDIERVLQQNYLNSVPTVNSAIDKPKTKDPVEAVLLHPLSAFAEAYRNLATSLTYAARPKTGKMIGITSALPKEGKTTTSIGIARVLSAAGSRVLLMDTDLRRRSITQTLALSTAVGLIEVLRGEATLDQALFTDQSGAMVLPLAPHAHQGPMPFEGEQFEQLLQTVRANFDVIIVDTAPILAVTDTRHLLHHFDALALLTRWRATPAKAVRAAIHQIEAVEGRVTGIALTMVNLKSQAEAGYGDPSYYYGYTKDYYAAS